MIRHIARALSRADWFGLALIGGFIHLIYITSLLKGYYATDLSAFYAAGLAVAHGLPDAMYDTVPSGLVIGTPDRIRELLAGAALPVDKTPPYLYPPIWGYLMAPITRHVSIHTFFDVMIGMQSFMLAMMPWIGYRIARPKRLNPLHWLSVGFALLFLSSTNLAAIAQNQLQITVAFLTLTSLLALSRGHSRSAGMLLGLAAAIKIAPAVFGLLFLLRRDWRAVVAMALTGGALLAVSVGLGGVELHLTMLERLGAINDATILSRVNLSPEMVLYELRRVILDIPPNVTRSATSAVFDTPGWIHLLSKLCLNGTILWIAVVHIRKGLTLASEALILSLAIALFGPLSWMHYFVLPFAITPAIFNLFSPRSGWLWIILGGGLTSVALLSRLNPLNQEVMWAPMPATFYFLSFFLALLIRASLGAQGELRNGNP